MSTGVGPTDCSPTVRYLTGSWIGNTWLHMLHWCKTAHSWVRGTLCTLVHGTVSVWGRGSMGACTLVHGTISVWGRGSMGACTLVHGTVSVWVRGSMMRPVTRPTWVNGNTTWIYESMGNGVDTVRCSFFLTRFNKIAIQGTPQMAVD